MTKKDYVFVANILRFSMNHTDPIFKLLVEEFSKNFKVDNPKFDEKKFKDAACRVMNW